MFYTGFTVALIVVTGPKGLQSSSQWWELANWMHDDHCWKKYHDGETSGQCTGMERSQSKKAQKMIER